MSKSIIIVFSSLLLAAFTVISWSVPLRLLGRAVSMNYNEGWNVYHTQTLLMGKPLYQMDFTPLNYPPGSFIVMAAMVRGGLDPLLAGRSVAFISLIITAVLTGAFVWKSEHSLIHSVWTGLVMLTVFSTVGFAYIGIDDPQFLAHVFILIGGIWYLFYPHKQKYAVCAGLSLAIGLLIKHSLIAFPLALVIDAVIRNDKNSKLFLVFFVGSMVFFIVLTEWASGGLFLQSLGMHRNSTMHKVPYMIRQYLVPVSVISSLGWICAIRWWNSPRYRVISWYIVLSSLTGMYFLAGEGTNVNVLFEYYISIIIALGILVSELDRKAVHFVFHQKRIAALIVCLITFILAVQTIPLQKTMAVFNRERITAWENQSRKDSLFIRNQAGPALCETLLLCYWAGKSFEYDPFISSQLAKSNAEYEKKLVALVTNHHFPVIQLGQEITEEEILQAGDQTQTFNFRFTAAMLSAIQQSYTLVDTNINGAFYIPIKPQQ